MTHINEKAKQSDKSDIKSNRRSPLGQGHEDITDDLSALLNVFGFDGLSSKLKRKALRIVGR